MLSADALDSLRAYDWPGNVRELENVVERAIITVRGGPLHFELPVATRRQEPERDDAPVVKVRTEEELRTAERANIVATLNMTRWKVYGRGGAAELLGIKPGTLAARIKKLGLRP